MGIECEYNGTLQKRLLAYLTLRKCLTPRWGTNAWGIADDRSYCRSLIPVNWDILRGQYKKMVWGSILLLSQPTFQCQSVIVTVVTSKYFFDSKTPSIQYSSDHNIRKIGIKLLGQLKIDNLNLTKFYTLLCCFVCCIGKYERLDLNWFEALSFGTPRPLIEFPVGNIFPHFVRFIFSNLLFFNCFWNRLHLVILILSCPISKPP